MSERWEVGDVAVCINDGLVETYLYVGTGEGLKKGGLYRVTGFKLDEDDGALILTTIERPDGWYASRFRKLRPSDDSFTRRIRACQPHRDRVPA